MLKCAEKLFAVLVAALMFAGGLRAGDVVKSAAADRTDLSLVIYNSNLALVRETRRVTLGKGEVEIRLADVGRMLQPSSVIASPGGGVKLIEQRYLYDPLNRQNLLDAFVGLKVLVEIKNERTGVVESKEAVLLSNDGGPILQVDGRVELEPGGRIILPELPEGLVAEPVLSWLVESNKSGGRELGLSYLTNGLSWQCEYVLNVDSDGKNAELGGWVTLRNNSGADFRGAQVHLIAGQVNREAVQEYAPAPRAMEMRTSLAAKADAGGAMEPQEQFEYYRYTLPRVTDILNNQNRQVELFAPGAIDVEKIYRLNGSQHYFYGPAGSDRDPVSAQIILSWKAGGKEPLPAGLVRVYEKDSAGDVWFAGEDGIQHTAPGQKVEITAGGAFDVKGLRRQVEFQRVSDRLRRVTVEIELTNARKTPVKVQVDEPLPGDWKITEKTHDWEKLDANRIRFTPTVPAGSSVKVRYTVELI